MCGLGRGSWSYSGIVRSCQRSPGTGREGVWNGWRAKRPSRWNQIKSNETAWPRVQKCQSFLRFCWARGRVLRCCAGCSCSCRARGVWQRQGQAARGSFAPLPCLLPLHLHPLAGARAKRKEEEENGTSHKLPNEPSPRPRARSVPSDPSPAPLS